MLQTHLTNLDDSPTVTDGHLPTHPSGEPAGEHGAVPAPQEVDRDGAQCDVWGGQVGLGTQRQDWVALVAEQD